MNAMQQQGGTHLGDGGTGGTRAAAAARQPTFTALDPQRALTDRLMEQICDGPSLGLASLVVNMIRYNIEETAVYDKYVRWCGRTGPLGPSYPNPARRNAQAAPKGNQLLVPASFGCDYAAPRGRQFAWCVE